MPPRTPPPSAPGSTPGEIFKPGPEFCIPHKRSDDGLYLFKENFMSFTFEDETYVLNFLFHVLSFLFVKVTF